MPTGEIVNQLSDQAGEITGYNLSASQVVYPNVDETLSIRGKAADAKATGDALNSKLSIADALVTPHKNVNGVNGLTEYPTRVGNYRVTSTRFDGLPARCGLYGELHIFGQEYHTHIYVDMNSNAWIAWSSSSGGDVTIPTVWNRIDNAQFNTTTSKVYTNSYCSITATWVTVGKLVTLHINMTPTQNVESSTGAVSLVDVPSSLTPIASTCWATSNSTSLIRSMNLSGRNITCYGHFTNGTTYYASFNYISA